MDRRQLCRMYICLFSYLVLASMQVNGSELSTFSPFGHLTKEYKVSNGKSIFVFDGAVPENRLVALNYFMSANDNWRYVLHDPTVFRARLFDDKNGIPWKSWSDPAPLKATIVGSQLKNMIQIVDNKLKNGSESNFEMNEIYSALVRRGDRTRMHQEADENEDSYSLAIFYNIVWRKNAYGELLLFDEDGEIAASVRPKFGRIVVWHSSISYLFRPPSISQLTTQSLILAHFSSDVTKNIRKLNQFKIFVERSRNSPPVNTWLSSFSAKVTDESEIGKHLTLMKRNRKNHVVAVFDGLFDDEALISLRSWIVQYGQYFYDGSLDVSSDNVQWIAGINVDDFVKTHFWPTIHQVAKFVSKSSKWYPYDVACNLIRNYDHTRFHLDTSYDKEKEMTFLLYLSQNWTAADYGETAFMESNDDDPANEYVAEVVPTFGRAVIFDGNFPHSAHPPSVLNHNARYTLAVKLSYTKLVAVRKTFDEEFRHEPGQTQTVLEVKKLADNPKYSVAMQKLMSVAEHLSIRNLQKRLMGSHNPSIDEHDEEDEDDDDMPDENTEIMLESLLGEVEGNEEMEELWTSLRKDQQIMLASMIKHHDLESAAQSSPDENIDFIPSFLNPEKRASLIKKWKKITSKNADELNDYLEVYLRQRPMLKNYAQRKMLSLL